MQNQAGDTLISREGQFVIDEEGYLSLPEAGRVMGENGPIMVNDSDFVIVITSYSIHYTKLYD